MKILYVLPFLLLCGCCGLQKKEVVARIVVSSDGTRFLHRDQSGATPFRPIGFNYDRDYKMRLIEDYWDREWTTVEEDFREMKRLGANVVRVHLQFSKFMEGPSTPNPHSLRQLRRLLELAETFGLYLDVTGLACYRKQDVPAWYDTLSESERWKAQAAFWGAVARECKDSPAVFCYDLMNEPYVPGSARKSTEWLIGELAGFWYVQAITLDPAGRDRTAVARQWIEMLVRAIREVDSSHLITVGMLPNSLERHKDASGFDPSKVSAELDFIAVHIYPTSKTVPEDLSTLRGFDVGKPLVVEEIFPLGCNPAELKEFMKSAGDHVDGWVGFYWGQTPEQLATEESLGAKLTLGWLNLFQEIVRD